MTFLRPTLLTLACLFAAHTGASDLPSLGDASSSIVSPQQEHQLGRAWLGLLRGQVSQLDDPQLKDFVESSVYRLSETSQLQDRRLEFVLLNSPQLNAFAAPGGIVGVNGGLFLYAQTEAEYASVMAHELAHLSQRHFARGVEAQQRMQLPMMAAMLAGIVAAAAGAGDGLKLALNIGAMLLAFIALIALINAPLTWFGDVTGLAAAIGKPTDLATIFGYLLAPIAWVIGVPWQDATTVGSLIGQKVVINEFVAYLQLAGIVNGQTPGVTLTDEGRLIATYALCGFANFSSIAIQIGGIGGLAPERRSDLARFGLRAVLGGTIATLMTATIAGVLSHFG